MVNTLYNICIEKLVLQSSHIVDLEGVPFEPYLLDLLGYVFTDSTCSMIHQHRKHTTVNVPNLLARIGDAHGSTLRQPRYIHFGSLCHTRMGDGNRLLQHDAFSDQRGAPQFITQLDLSMSGLMDDDIPYLKSMVNLVVLDLTATKVSDYGVSHLSRLSQLDHQQRVGLRHLRTLSLAYNKNITDGSLKYLPNITTLCGIDLSATNVHRQVATFCLKKHTYVCNDRGSLTPSIVTAPSMHGITQRLKNGFYASRQGDRKLICPSHPLTLITYASPNDKSSCNVIINDNLNLLITGDDMYGHNATRTIDADRRRWVIECDEQSKVLVFTRSSPSATTTTTTTSHMGKKRSFKMTADSGGGGGGVTTTDRVPQRRSLQVKQSQTALSLLENFQW